MILLFIILITMLVGARLVTVTTILLVTIKMFMVLSALAMTEGNSNGTAM